MRKNLRIRGRNLSKAWEPANKPALSDLNVFPKRKKRKTKPYRLGSVKLTVSKRKPKKRKTKQRQGALTKAINHLKRLFRG